VKRFDSQQVEDGFAVEKETLDKKSSMLFGEPWGPKYSDCFVPFGKVGLIEPGASDVNVMLPYFKDADRGRVILIKHNNDSTNDVIIYGASGQTIDGAASITLTARECAVLVAELGKNWARIV
jgi:hypothetical protein